VHGRAPDYEEIKVLPASDHEAALEAECGRVEELERQLSRERVLKQDAYRYQQAAEDLLNPEQKRAAAAESLLAQARAELERRAKGCDELYEAAIRDDDNEGALIHSTARNTHREAAALLTTPGTGDGDMASLSERDQAEDKPPITPQTDAEAASARHREGQWHLRRVHRWDDVESLAGPNAIARLDCGHCLEFSRAAFEALPAECLTQLACSDCPTADERKQG
jgi:hypothetical protein